MLANLHYPERPLIELTMEHAESTALIDCASDLSPADEPSLRPLEKHRPMLRNEMQPIRGPLMPDGFP